MEFLKKIFYRSKIEKTKSEIGSIIEKLASFWERNSAKFCTTKATPQEKKLLSDIRKLLEQLANFSLSELLAFVIEADMGQKAREVLSTLSANIFEGMEKRGEKLLTKAFFSQSYQNHSALAPFLPSFLKFGIHHIRPLLPKIFRYHEKSLALRCGVIENLARIIKKSELEPLFELLKETHPEEALEIYFALCKNILPEHLKPRQGEVLAFFDSPPTVPLGSYLLGYMGKLALLEGKILAEEHSLEQRLAMLNSISLNSRANKLSERYQKIFERHPDLIKPFFEQARDLSLFTPRGDEVFVISMLKGEQITILKEGVESILEYRPEFKKYLWESIQKFPSMPTPVGLAILQVLREIKDPLVVPLLIQVYVSVPDLQQMIVQVVSQLQKGDRLGEILTHFKRRTKQRLVSEMIDRIIEKKRKEKYK